MTPTATRPARREARRTARPRPAYQCRAAGAGYGAGRGANGAGYADPGFGPDAGYAGGGNGYGGNRRDAAPAFEPGYGQAPATVQVPEFTPVDNDDDDGPVRYTPAIRSAFDLHSA